MQRAPSCGRPFNVFFPRLVFFLPTGRCQLRSSACRPRLAAWLAARSLSLCSALLEGCSPTGWGDRELRAELFFCVCFFFFLVCCCVDVTRGKNGHRPAVKHQQRRSEASRVTLWMYVEAARPELIDAPPHSSPLIPGQVFYCDRDLAGEYCVLNGGLAGKLSA